ncbi:hypothetical protein [uncultured Ottowia sp.]|uniref:hypothetical protein n=1 Tax=uncultured Ottowia sp. TaxID=543067 RepID=UPI0025973C0F|nr:hypothetical protein [uncultured Ottowia sp.]
MHSVTEFSRPVILALVAMVLAAKGLRNEKAAKALLLMPPAELWRLVLEAYAQDKAAFENLPMGMHERLTTEQSQAICTGLALGTMYPITSLSRKAA